VPRKNKLANHGFCGTVSIMKEFEKCICKNKNKQLSHGLFNLPW
jgi:hypothetical protein